MFLRNFDIRIVLISRISSQYYINLALILCLLMGESNRVYSFSGLWSKIHADYIPKYNVNLSMKS